MKRVGIFVTAALGLALSGCSLGGSNVKGSWNCAAAEGTCAPTVSIDDGAIKQIIGDTGEAASAGGSSAAIYGSETVGRRAKMEFPAYTDERGRYHEPQIVYMNVNLFARIC